MNVKRNTNLDLLRIISMMMVVMGHFFSHGGLMDGKLVPWTFNWLLGNMIYTGCLVAVDCFVLLSGYFQCTSKLKTKRLRPGWMPDLTCGKLKNQGSYALIFLYL